MATLLAKLNDLTSGLEDEVIIGANTGAMVKYNNQNFKSVYVSLEDKSSEFFNNQDHRKLNICSMVNGNATSMDIKFPMSSTKEEFYVRYSDDNEQTWSNYEYISSNADIPIKPPIQGGENMAVRKRLTGYTENTMKNRQTGAGVYLKNFDVETDTFTTAVAAGKLIGATQGGGSFSAVPTITTTEIDGVPSDAVGMEDIDGWTAEMTANIVEVTAETMAEALGAAVVTTTTLSTKNYKKITGKMYLEESDYRDNITFLGSMSGYDDPVIIQIYNAIAMEGININPQDKKTTLNTTKWKAHSSFDNLDEAPFAIYVPYKA